MKFQLVDRFHWSPNVFDKMTIKELEYWYDGLKYICDEESKSIEKAKNK